MPAIQRRLRTLLRPRPGIAEPECRQQMQGGWFRPAIDRVDSDAHVLGSGLGVFDEDVKVAVLVKNAGVEQFILQRLPVTPAVCLNEVFIWVGRGGIFIMVFFVITRRRSVYCVIVFI